MQLLPSSYSWDIVHNAVSATHYLYIISHFIFTIKHLKLTSVFIINNNIYLGNVEKVVNVAPVCRNLLISVGADGVCEAYSSAICSRQLGGNQLVFKPFNSSLVQDENSFVAEHFKILSSVSDLCRHAAERLLCRYTFQDCYIAPSGQHIAQPICR